jgi:hypothetical protein
MGFGVFTMIPMWGQFALAIWTHPNSPNGLVVEQIGNQLDIFFM